MPKAVDRVDEMGDTIRVVSKDNFRGLAGQIQRFAPSFNLEYRNGKVRVFTGDFARDGLTDFEFTPENAIFYETDVTERELTEEEVEWCEDTVMYSGSNKPEVLFEFEMPHPDELKDAILESQFNSYEGLKAVIPSYEARESIMNSLQERIEEGMYQSNQLQFSGNPHNLPPEMHPDSADEERSSLRKIATTRYSAYMDSWKEATGLRYYKMREARCNVLGLSEPKIDDHHRKIIDLELIGEEDKSYCRSCAATWKAENLLEIKMKGYDGRKLRVCEDCARMREGQLFTVDAVAAAFDRRARSKDNGQRRLHSDFA